MLRACLVVGLIWSAGFASPDAAEVGEQHHRRGVELFRQREPAKAAEQLELSLKAKPSQPQALKLLGLCYQLTGARNKAEAAFEQTVELAPKDSEAWFFIGRLYYDQNFFGKARRALSAAVDLDPSDQRFHTYLGLTLEAAGQTDQALRAYREAIQRNQKQPRPSFRPHFSYGVLLSKLNRLQEGQKRLLRARQVRFELAKLQYKLGAYADALKEIQEALKTGSPTEEGAGRLYYLLARVYFKLGRDQDGQEALAMREEVER